ncbi:MAG: hypothetical protein HYY05_02320 [Chloroflexi bacterium]|nr:hypothetical protein [Chloroflexota bacterium]
MVEPLVVAEAACAEDAAAIRHFRQSILGGKHWYLALLEAIGLWRSAVECVDGRSYAYLLGGEAFDYLLLAERLCGAAPGLVPEQEQVDLLFFGRPPLALGDGEVRACVGPGKYRAMLNFHYGVTVEQALQLVAELEIEKERAGIGGEAEADVFQRIYNSGQQELIDGYRREHGLLEGPLTWHHWLSFTYWLFKYRLVHCDPARVASDTKKALLQLRRLRGTRTWVPCVDPVAATAVEGFVVGGEWDS